MMEKLCLNLPAFVTLKVWCPAGAWMLFGSMDHSFRVTAIGLPAAVPPLPAAAVVAVGSVPAGAAVVAVGSAAAGAVVAVGAAAGAVVAGAASPQAARKLAAIRNTPASTRRGRAKGNR